MKVVFFALNLGEFGVHFYNFDKNALISVIFLAIN